MILQNSSDLKELVVKLNNHICKSNITVKRQRLYAVFAQTQGFKTDAALRDALPILIDTRNLAANVFLGLVERYGIKSEGFKALGETFFKEAARSAKPFPIVAPQSFHVRMSVDWRDGFVCQPYLCHDSNRNSGAWDERNGHSSSFELSVTVFQEEFEELVGRIKPLIQRVVDGYTYNGREEAAAFSTDAVLALETIDYVVSEFEFACNSSEGGHPSDLYGDDIVIEGEVEESGLTEVHANGDLLFDYSYSDIELRQLVATELASAEFPVNDEALFDFFRGLRDECLKNHDQE